MSLSEFFAWLAATVGISGLVSALVAHRLTISREARAGRDPFRGHLGRWIGELEGLRNPTNADIRRIHMKYAPDISGYAGRIEKSFWNQGTFRRLCRDVCEETGIGNHQEYVAKMVHKIRALLDFV